LFAGALADRVDRKRLMVGANIVQAVLVGSIPLAAAFGVLSIMQIYAVALLSMTAFVWFDAANFGALPALFGRLIGAANAIALDAVGFLISSVLLLFITRSFNTSHTPDLAGTSIVSRVLIDIREGLAFLWQHQLIRTLSLVGFGNSFSSGAVFGLLVVYAVQALGLTTTDGRVGLLYTATAIGGLAASLLLPLLTRRISVGRITRIGLVAHLIVLITVALAPNLWVGLLLIGVWALCNTLIVINGIALRQQVTPDHLQARVNTTARMIAWGGQPFGAAAGGALAEARDVRTALMIVAIGVGVSTIYGWFSPLREPPIAHAPAIDASN
jgi:MFS family permease